MQNSFAWDQRYSVGNAVLDEQHRKFLTLCEKVVVCLDSQGEKGREAYHILLDDLSNHAATHFRTEEDILAASGYTGLDRHLEEHNYYFERLTDLLLAATAGRLDKEGLRSFVTSWWVNHILESDMRYAALFRGEADAA